jgi:hypothetical protein
MFTFNHITNIVVHDCKFMINFGFNNKIIEIILT